MTMFLSVAMVGCYSTEEPVGPDVPVVGSLKLSQEEMTISPEGGEFSVDIFTEYAYETSTNVDWITISGGSCGTEYCTLYFTVAKNDTTSEREGVITVFCDDYNLSATLTVTQEAGENAGNTIPNNEIWYTSSDSKVVTPNATDVFGANIVSNTYENGKGIITFDGDVTQIGNSAFHSCKSLTSITIPESVTSIGESAFPQCASLTTITIPDSVTSIGGSAFSSCTSLTNVTIGNSVTSIGSYTFRSCTSLTTITIPDSVTEIGECAFESCSSLTTFYGKFASSDNRCLIVDGMLHSFAIGCGATEYTIPDSVTEIGTHAFWSCTSLTSITIPQGVTEIGDVAFARCTSLISIAIPDSVTSIGGQAFRQCYSLTSIIVPDGITQIREYTFWLCTSLTSITIPDSVTSIGDWAFSQCSSLTSVTIPNSVTSIGKETFYNCTSLTSVTIPNSVTSVGDNAFYNCTSLTAFYGKFASADNRCLIVDGMLHSFAIGCGLTEYTIPDSVTSIGSSAFYDCTSLTSITIPDSVTSIGGRAFYSCTSLTSITIPDSVTSIGVQTFYGCTSLKEVYCKPTTPPTGASNMFNNNASGRKIYVPAASVEAYKAADGWSDYADYIVGYDF